MPIIEVRRYTLLSPEQAFERVTTWEDHKVPFTRTRRTELGFVARTAIGPIGFDDPMTVTAWEPPRFCRIEKTGNVVRGWAEIEIEVNAKGTCVSWREDLSVRHLPKFTDRFTAFATKAMISRIHAALLPE